jgi:cation transport ATPase
MEHSNRSEHRQDGMGHAMHEGHRETGPKDGDHTGHHAHMAADFRKRFWISLVVTLPILVLSPMLQELVGLREIIRFPGDLYVLFSLSSAVFWYGGWPFLKGLFEELTSGRPGMMTLPTPRRCGSPLLPWEAAGSPSLFGWLSWARTSRSPSSAA